MKERIVEGIAAVIIVGILVFGIQSCDQRNQDYRMECIKQGGIMQTNYNVCIPVTKK